MKNFTKPFSKNISGMFLLLALFAFALTGCGSQAALTAAGGTLLLKVNPEIAIKYDEKGLVTNIEARNDDAAKIIASYDGFVGKEARVVANDLVTAIGRAGYFVEDVDGETRKITIELTDDSVVPDQNFLNGLVEDIRNNVNSNQWNSEIQVQTHFDDTDYGPNNDGVTDYNDTDYGPNNDGVTDYNDTDYGPNNDGVTDYNDTDYGPNNDGVTDYNDTDYGPNNDGVTDYNDTDYGPNNDGVTDYNDTDYGPNNDGVTDYNDTDYGPNNDGVTDYNDTDYGPNNDGVTDYKAAPAVAPTAAPANPVSQNQTDYHQSDYGNTDYSN